MSSLVLKRPSATTPWGFRIHGGKDFNQPIVVLKVNSPSIAESCQLSAGDLILKINGVNANGLKHKDAQELITRAGEQVELVVDRGGFSTWKPTTVGGKVSLKKNQEGKTLVPVSYNSPVGLYSEQNIAETLAAQAEVLNTGAIGVNFKKNDKPYKYEDSEVYKMLMLANAEDSKEPSTSDFLNSPSPIQPHHTAPRIQHSPKTPPAAAVQIPQFPMRTVNKENSMPAMKPMAPMTNAAPSAPQTNTNNNPNICAECERLIIGVFVRIKEKNLHVECFKCATCGQSLKNIGYYNIGGKLYCDVHAKTVAKAQPSLVGGSSSTTPRLSSAGFEDLPQEPPLPPTTTAEDTFPNCMLSQLTVNTDAAASQFTMNDFLPDALAQPKAPDFTNNMAPLPYHTSPTQPHHVAAPMTSGTTFKEMTSSSSTSFKQETITKSSGSKIMWPPNRAPDDELFLPSAMSAPAPQSAPAEPEFQPVPHFPPPQQQPQDFAPPPPFIQQHQQPAFNNQPSGFNFKPGQFKPVSAPSAKPNTIKTGPPQGFNAMPPPFQQQQQFAPPQQPQQQFSAPPPQQQMQQQFHQQQMNLQQQQVQQQHMNQFTPPIQQQTNFPSAPAPQSFGSPAAPAPSGGGQGGKNLKNLLNARRGERNNPNRGRGVLNQAGPRIAMCSGCGKQIRGPFITALDLFYCPDHFKCTSCSRPLLEVGFVEICNKLHCEFCWETNLAPPCGKCGQRIKNECLNAVGNHFHPNCFCCGKCGAVFGNSPFYLEDGIPYCENDWNEYFTTKCAACNFTIEAGDRWVEALGKNFHSQCFACSACKKPLENQPFYAKAGRPFCKTHAR